MSWQGAGQHTPPLFLTQAQKIQLEKSFTDPLQRRINALQADVEYWQTTAYQFDLQAKELRTQITNLQANINSLDTELQTANRTITQQQQQITALQTRIAELEAQGSYPSNYAIVTSDRTFTTSTILWFSFNGGYGGDYIATYTRDADPSYGSVQIPTGSESAIILFNSHANAFDLFVDGQYIQNMTDVLTIQAEYNATSNNRITAFY